MGAGFKLASNLAPGAQSTGIEIRASRRPYRVQAYGGFAGNVIVQNSVNGGTSWADVGAVGSDESTGIDQPLTLVRVNGTHTGANATVVLIDDTQSRRWR